MDKSVRTLYELFQILCREQNSTWLHPSPGQEPPDHAYEIWGMLCGSWAPITEKELEELFSSSEKSKMINFSKRRKVLYLPLLQQDSKFVPVLTMQCDLGQACTDIKLRVMLVCRDEGKLCGVGFRMDRGEGLHSFYHAQLIRSLEPSPYAECGPSVECPHWLPETQPSFPVIADSSAALIICLLLSLYGIGGLTLVTEQRVFGLEPHLKKFSPQE